MSEYSGLNSKDFHEKLNMLNEDRTPNAGFKILELYHWAFEAQDRLESQQAHIKMLEEKIRLRANERMRARMELGEAQQAILMDKMMDVRTHVKNAQQWLKGDVDGA